MTKIAIIVGTVYGAAEALAEQALMQLKAVKYRVRLFTEARLDDVLAFTPDIWLVITSTTGAGDIPDNLWPFFAETRDRFPLLTGKSYAVIALGDSSYGETFCGGGQQFSELLAELQGTEIAPMLQIDATETTQPEDVALPWLTQHFSGQ